MTWSRLVVALVVAVAPFGCGRGGGCGGAAGPSASGGAAAAWPDPRVPLEPAPRYEVVDEVRAPRLSAGVASPDGRHVAFLSGHIYQEELFVWTPETDELRMLTDNHGERESYARIVWSPRSDAVLVPMRPLPGSGAMSLVRFAIDGSAERTLAEDPGAIAEMAWSPDASRVFFSGAEDRVQVIDVATGARRPLSPERQLAAHAFTPWRDGDRDVLAYVAGWLVPEKQIYLAALDGSGPVAITTDGGYAGLRVDPATRELVASRDDGAGHVEEVRVAPRTHAMQRGASRPGAFAPNEATTAVLSLSESALRLGRRTLAADRVGRIQDEALLRHVDARALAHPGIVLRPDPRSRPPGATVSRSARWSGSTTVIATTEIRPQTLARHVRLGALDVELLGVEVEHHGDPASEVDVAATVRWRHRIGSAVLRTKDQAAIIAVAVQTLRAPPLPEEAATIRDHFRQYSIAVRSVQIDLATGAWSSLSLALVRYDEAEGVPMPAGDSLEAR